MSGEPLSIYGESFKRFKISSLGQAALIVPVRAQKQVVALLVTMRKALKPFTASEQTLLEAVSDYASISLVNASLFRALEDRARSLQTAVENGASHERINAELLKNAGQELRAPLERIAVTAEGLLAGKFGRTNSDQRRLLETVQEQLAQLQRVADALSAPLTNGAGKMPASVNLSEVARQAAGLMQPYAQRAGQSLLCELTPEPLVAPGDAYQVLSIITGLLSNAIKHSPRGGQVTLRVSRAQEGKDPASARVSISDSGPGIEARHQPNLFERGYRAGAAPASGFGGLGISLALIKELVEGLGGKIWVESQPGQGASFHFSLPAIK
jgi:two-component system OmpR family sensor kinase